MNENFAGIGSVVRYKIKDDNEIFNAKIVVQKTGLDENEVLKTSPLGEALMFCQVGECLNVVCDDSYEIIVLGIDNPVKKEIMVDIRENKNISLTEEDKFNLNANHESETNAVKERKYFWAMYKEILNEQGNPFSFVSRNQYAIVNKKTTAWVEPCIAMDFLFKKSKMYLRVNVFIENDLRLYERLLKIRDKLDEDFLPIKPVWCDGESGENTRRIKIEIPYKYRSNEEYRRIILESIHYVKLFIKNYKPYIDC